MKWFRAWSVQVGPVKVPNLYFGTIQLGNLTRLAPTHLQLGNLTLGKEWIRLAGKEDGNSIWPGLKSCSAMVFAAKKSGRKEQKIVWGWRGWVGHE